MFDVLTILSKCTRVSRKCDSETLSGVPGLWVAVGNTGAVTNIIDNTVPKITKPLYNSNSPTNVYESHDVSVGRIATLEGAGIRAKTDMTVGTITAGDRLYVAYKKGSAANGNGKLQSFEDAGTVATTVCNIVAVAQEVGVGYVVIETVSQYTLTK